eukprot:990-Pyramimonas_sp.AAC.1
MVGVSAGAPAPMPGVPAGHTLRSHCSHKTRWSPAASLSGKEQLPVSTLHAPALSAETDGSGRREDERARGGRRRKALGCQRWDARVL